MTRACSNRIGLMADSPNFPAAWDQVVEKVKIADELGYDLIWLGESWGYELFVKHTSFFMCLKAHLQSAIPSLSPVSDIPLKKGISTKDRGEYKNSHSEQH